MANEAVIIELAGQPKGVPINYTLSGGQLIEKGTIMVISGATVQAAPATSIHHSFAGIASTEVTAAQGAVTIGCWTKGKFDLHTGTAITEGTMVVVSGANTIRPAVALDFISGAVIGKCLEKASANTTVVVAVGLYS